MRPYSELVNIGLKLQTLEKIKECLENVLVDIDLVKVKGELWIEEKETSSFIEMQKYITDKISDILQRCVSVTSNEFNELHGQSSSSEQVDRDAKSLKTAEKISTLVSKESEFLRMTEKVNEMNTNFTLQSKKIRKLHQKLKDLQKMYTRLEDTLDTHLNSCAKENKSKSNGTQEKLNKHFLEFQKEFMTELEAASRFISNLQDQCHNVSKELKKKQEIDKEQEMNVSNQIQHLFEKQDELSNKYENILKNHEYLEFRCQQTGRTNGQNNEDCSHIKELINEVQEDNKTTEEVIEDSREDQSDLHLLEDPEGRLSLENKPSEAENEEYSKVSQTDQQFSLPSEEKDSPVYSVMEAEKSEESTPRKTSAPKVMKNFLFSLWKKGEKKYRFGEKDNERYRMGYPGLKDDMNLKANYKFYIGKIESQPHGDYIDKIHKYWEKDYNRLELHDGYIQWIFPIREEDMNSLAQPLQLHEAEAIQKNPAAKARVLKSYKMMLGFYGMKLVDEERGTIQRAGNYRECFENLTYRTHNYLRITRILKSLGELGYEHLKKPFLEFVLHEALVEKTLAPTLSSCENYWIGTIKNDADREELYTLIDESNKAKNDRGPNPI
ncbi:reticulocyte-binding protein homolog 2a-like isoform X2 [Biomphalaria glabrata]|uniref:Reticulocyte-binding protein homolog 2a-like isoform X2 n=1 Tax=Biomphalaria glabrata TaxID=6526 RepID=A0A9W3BL32_BIOGL|nr:reticulocyte-binding protein homolog 2a-like isoform X2 [Biomphalaria glabrata]